MHPVVLAASHPGIGGTHGIRIGCDSYADICGILGCPQDLGYMLRDQDGARSRRSSRRALQGLDVRLDALRGYGGRSRVVAQVLGFRLMRKVQS